MRLLALFILTIGLSNVWAETRYARYIILDSTTDFKSHEFTEWTVVKGSETYTLKDFVSSGRFCEVFGHDWTEVLEDKSGPITIWYDSHTRFSCRRCKAKKIIRTDTREEISR